MKTAVAIKQRWPAHVLSIPRRHPQLRFLVLLAVLVLLAAACGGDEADRPNAEPAAGTKPDTSAWNRVPHVETLFGGEDEQLMRAVAAGGPGFVAVGWDAAGGNRDAAVWTSHDGRKWSRVPHDEKIFGGPEAQLMAAVTQADPGLLAVGTDASGGDFDAAVWFSPDGLTWMRVLHDESALGGDNFQVMQTVTAAPGRIVAGGADTSGGDFDAALWFSSDGLRWRRITHDEELFGGPNEQDINAVTAGGPGFVAAGFDESDAPGDRDVAVWTSIDGLRWTRVPHSEELFGGADEQVPTAIASRSSQIVAVGYDESRGDRDAAVWISPDGRSWSRAPKNEAAFGGMGNQVMAGVAAGPIGVVAVGRNDEAGTRSAVAWVSADGIQWRRVEADDAFRGGAMGPVMLGVTIDRDQIVAVGADATGGDDDAVVWRSP